MWRCPSCVKSMRSSCQTTLRNGLCVTLVLTNALKTSQQTSYFSFPAINWGRDRWHNWLRHTLQDGRFRVRFPVGSIEIFSELPRSLQQKYVPKNCLWGKVRPACNCAKCQIWGWKPKVSFPLWVLMIPYGKERPTAIFRYYRKELS